MRGTSGIVIAMITFLTLDWMSEISAIASRIAGIAIRPSMIRMTTASSRRTKPVTRPIARPRTVASAATLKPTRSEIRLP